MTSINFTGLASGLDTDLIISSLMEIERQPLNRLEHDKQFQQNRLEAFKIYNDKLTALNAAVGELHLSGGLRESKVTLSNDAYFSANVTSAQAGTYEVTVEKLAQVQKSASENAYDSRTSKIFGTGDLTLEVGGTPHTISITASNNSLNGIVNAINEESGVHGISASIVDNGNEGGDRYYLVLTGADSSMQFTLDDSGLEGGTGLTMVKTQEAQQAEVSIDGIKIFGKTNTIENAINGVTLTLDSVSPDNGSGGFVSTTMSISLNKHSVAEKIGNFVSAYNDIVAFVSGQATEEAPLAGMLKSDNMVNMANRGLQNMLTRQVEGNGSFKALAQLGLYTKKDGTLSIDNTKLNAAVENNFDEVVDLMAGDNGIFKQYRSYLNNQLNSSTGLYATRQQNVQRITSRLDRDIERMEVRLEKREEIMVRRFAAMETLVSSLNAQGDYLTQQMDMLSNMGGKKK